jgi:tetratricopeptide (TPR) repeat protein
MNSPRQTKNGTDCFLTRGATRETHRRGVARVTVVLLSLCVVVAGIGLSMAWLRHSSDPLAAGRRAYDRGDWAAAAEAARAALKTHHDDDAALRILGRSSVQLGHDKAAIDIYGRRLDARSMQAEDYLQLGVALKRRRQDDGAGWAWNKALETEPIASRTLADLTKLLHAEAVESENPENVSPHPLDAAARAAERLCQRAGWESRGDLMLSIIRSESLDLSGAAEAIRRLLTRDPGFLDRSAESTKLRKGVARTFLAMGRPAEARPHVQSILARGPDSEASWLLSRVYLQQGAIPEAQAALARSGSYRSDNPLRDEPSPYVGEARCQSCHAAIFQKSLNSRHTQTYYRGPQLQGLPRPSRPLADPTDPNVTHAIQGENGSLWEETRVRGKVYRAVIEYAFGTRDRYLTMVSRDTRDQYLMARLSYYHTADGEGWDRTFLAIDNPTQAEGFRGETISVRAGVARCLYCHTTYPRAGRDRNGPESADRAIGCERCHGPAGNHLAAVAAGLSDLAIVSLKTASPQAVTRERCNDCHILDRSYTRGNRENPAWVRSQGAGWTWSRCNIESKGAFGCTSCHDPHQGVRSTTTAGYEAKCLTCHSATPVLSASAPGAVDQGSSAQRPTVCSINPANGCIKCHMPGVRMDSSHRDFTDHYIRISRPSRP